MDKYDVDDILYDGNEEEIREVRCSECGGYMEFSFYMEETVNLFQRRKLPERQECWKSDMNKVE